MQQRAFEHVGPAEVDHINLRKAGRAKTGKVVACDLRLIVACNDVFSFFDECLPRFLFDAEGLPRNAFLGPIPYLIECEHYSFKLKGTKHASTGCKLKKFFLQAMPDRPHGTLVTFTLTLKPENNDVALYAKYLHDVLDIELYPTDGALDLASELIGELNQTELEHLETFQHALRNSGISSVTVHRGERP
jgi:hypothetical protein